MNRKFPYSAVITALIPLGIFLLIAIRQGVIVQNTGPEGQSLWSIDLSILGPNSLNIGFFALIALWIGLRGLWKAFSARRRAERFEEQGYLTNARILSVETRSATNKLPTTDVVVALTGSPEVKLKKLPYTAVVGREVGDDLPVYALPDDPSQLIWAGAIDGEEEHTFEVYEPADRKIDLPDSLDGKFGGLANRLVDRVADKIAQAELARDAMDRSYAVGSGGSGQSTAIPTKFARVGFFDFFLIGFFCIHGGIFFTVGSAFTFSGAMPWFFGLIFLLVGVAEFCLIAFFVVRLFRKLGRRAALSSGGEQKWGVYQGSRATNTTVNGVARRAMLLEIDGQLYRHGSFAPNKIDHLREGHRLKILQNRNDPRSVLIADFKPQD